jgi:hypothetical protein
MADTVIEHTEADVIREIFDAYIAGASLKAIAEELTGRKIPYSERQTHGIKRVSPESSTTPSTPAMKNMTPSLMKPL